MPIRRSIPKISDIKVGSKIFIIEPDSSKPPQKYGARGSVSVVKPITITKVEDDSFAIFYSYRTDDGSSGWVAAGDKGIFPANYDGRPTQFFLKKESAEYWRKKFGSVNPNMLRFTNKGKLIKNKRDDHEYD